ITAGIAAADLGQGGLGVRLPAHAVLREAHLQQRAGGLVVRREALEQEAELVQRQRVVAGGVVALAQPVQGVGRQPPLRELLQEVLEQVGRFVVAAGLEHREGGVVGGPLGVADRRRGGARGTANRLDRQARRGRGRGCRRSGVLALGRQRRGRRQGRRGTAFQPQQAAVHVQVLGAGALVQGLQRVLQFLHLAAQRAHFVLERLHLPQQVGIALVDGDPLLQRRHPLGQAGALRLGCGRRGQQQRHRNEGGSKIHRKPRSASKTAKE